MSAVAAASGASKVATAAAKTRSTQYVRWSKIFLSRLPNHHREVLPLLPNHYQRALYDSLTREPLPVHWKPEPGKYRRCPHTGERVRVLNVPVWSMKPAAADQGLWGGEGLVTGFRIGGKRLPNLRQTPALWRPRLIRRVFYSEILDKHLQITCTMRTLDLVDEAHGFDNYILKTHAVDLRSRLGMRLKRKMLLMLAGSDELPGDSARQERIRETYKEFIIPVEEAEWVGRELGEAVQLYLKKQREANPEEPLKNVFTQQLMLQLTEQETDSTEESKSSGGSVFSRFNPFTSKK